MCANFHETENLETVNLLSQVEMFQVKQDLLGAEIYMGKTIMN